jgi:uncharacterized membrane protein
MIKAPRWMHHVALSAQQVHPARFLWWVGLVFGFVFVFTLPPFQSIDETAHFYRSYQIATGQLVATQQGNDSGGLLPSSVAATVNEFFFKDSVKQDVAPPFATIQTWLTIPLRPEQQTFVDFRNTAVYSPIPYLPAAVGMSLGHQLGLAPLFSLYLGRLTTMLVALGLAVLAVKYTPVRPWLFLLIALLPMVAVARSSLSIDGMIASLALLFIALTLHYAYGNVARISWRDLLILGTAASAIALTRSIYIVLVGLLFLIPQARFAGWAGRLSAIGLVGTIVFGTVGGWAWLSTQSYVPVRANEYKLYNPEHGTNLNEADTIEFNPRAQLAYIQNNPLAFLQTLGTFFVTQTRTHIFHEFGRFGWNGQIHSLHKLGYVLMLIAAIFCAERRQISFTWAARSWMFAIWAGGVLLVIVSGYLLWNEVGARTIYGIQGRYFLPFFPLLALLIGGKLAQKAPIISLQLPVIGLCIVSLCATWLAMIAWFYASI